MTLQAAACKRNPLISSAGDANEWAVRPNDLLAKGRCEEAITLLEAIPVERRKALWYSTYVPANTMCMSKHENPADYKAALLKVLEEGEQARSNVPAVKYWYGVILERNGDTEAARLKYAEARALATDAIGNASGPLARYEGSIILRNLDANGK